MTSSKSGLIVAAALVALVGASLRAAPVFAANHSGTIAVDESWFAADNPHVVISSVTVSSGVTLTIEDGVEVRFNAGAGLGIYGSLSAVGTPGQGILFTRHGASNWAGLTFYTAGSGSLDQCTLEYASYAVYAAGAGTVSVANSTIRNSGYGLRASGGVVQLASTTFTDNTSYGFHGTGVAPTLLDDGVVFDNCGTGVYLTNVGGLSLTSAFTSRNNATSGVTLASCLAPALDNLTLTGNTGANGALLIDDCGDFSLGAGNVIGGDGLANSWPVSITAGSYPDAAAVIPTAGNTNNDIRVAGGSSARTGTWRRFPGLRYVATGTTVVAAGGGLTVEDGAEVRFNAGAGLGIYGSLSAVGTPGQGILFTRHGASNWAGLTFYTAGSGSLDQCTLEYASYAVYAAGAGTVSVANSTIRNSGYGLRASGGVVQLASTTFTDNTSYGFHGTGVAPTLLDNAVVFDNCGTGVYLTNVGGLSLTTAFTSRNNATSGVTLASCLAPALDNLTLTGNTGANGALLIDDCGDFSLGAGNVIGGDGLANSWPVSITAGSYPDAAAVIPTAGNTNNDIRVAGGSSARTGTWRRFPGLRYVATGTTVVAAGGGLTVEDGAEVRFNAGAGLGIYGSLSAVGTPGQGILFTRHGASNWAGLTFYTAGAGSLDQCTLEYASYAVYAAGAGTVSVANSTIRNSGYGLRASGGVVQLASTTFTDNTSYGFHGTGVAPTLLDDGVVFDNCGTGVYLTNVGGLSLTSAFTSRNNATSGVTLASCLAPALDNLTLTGNTGANGALLIDDCGDFSLGAGNVIGGDGLANSWPVSITAGSYPDAAAVIPTAGNTNNDIRVAGGSSARTGTWRRFPGLRYVATGTTVVAAGGGLTVEDGAEVRFNAGAGLGIYGSLSAVGTPGQGILFTRHGASNWAGLTFYTAGAGTLDQCILEYASYAVYAAGTGTVSVANSTIRNSGYGVRCDTGTVTLLHARIIDNTQYGIYIANGTLVFGNDLSEWNDVYGNGSGNPGRDLRNGNADLTAGYVHWGTMDWWEVEAVIWDLVDAPALGRVTYIPFASADHSDMITATPEEPAPGATPANFELRQNVPNPFNPSTEIAFDLPAPGRVRLTVYDLTGALVATLVDSQLPQGRQRVDWRGCDDAGRPVASGAYVYRIEAGAFVSTKRMQLVR